MLWPSAAGKQYSGEQQMTISVTRDKPGRLLLVTLVAALLGSPSSVMAAKDGDTFQDWTMRCEKAEETGPEQCHVFQNAKDEKTGRDVAQMAVGRVPNDPKPLVIVSLPLGVYLPPGVLIQVDDKEPIRIPIEVCDPAGCRAGFPLTNEVQATFKAGLTANVTVQDAAGRQASVPLSLKGFTAALNALPQI
jgi:invasion protein IalB